MKKMKKQKNKNKNKKTTKIFSPIRGIGNHTYGLIILKPKSFHIRVHNASDLPLVNSFGPRHMCRVAMHLEMREMRRVDVLED